MQKRTRKRKCINVLIIPNSIDNIFLDLLFRNIRFINYERNKNNPLVHDECWVRGDDSLKYTTIKYNGKTELTHRVSYEIFKGKIILNDGCHHCDTPACINPIHIFDGTQKQNNWDALRKHRNHQISLDDKARMDTAEKRLRKVYPNEKIVITKVDSLSLAARLKKLSGNI